MQLEKGKEGKGKEVVRDKARQRFSPNNQIPFFTKEV